MTGERVAGINIGGTTTSVAIADSAGAVLSLRRWPTQATDGEALCAAIAKAVRELTSEVIAAGIAVGGPVAARDGVVTGAPHLPGLHGFPLRDRISAALACPVLVHHDAAACALAEWRWGPDAGALSLAYLTCGTGFGAGLVLDGRVRYGSDGRSPEIGHVRFRDDGPDIFGKPGCYEGYGSAKALALLAVERDPDRYGGATPADVVRAARAGEPVAAAAVADNIAAVGSACALLADLLVLDVIVLGSLALYVGQEWIGAVYRKFAAEALPENVERCRLRAPMADVQDRSGVAAALDALEQNKKPAGEPAGD